MSNDININESAILETLNAKIDYDGGNYKGSGLANYVVDKTGDIMTGKLSIQNGGMDLVHPTVTKGTAPANTAYQGIRFNDKNSNTASSYADTRLGLVESVVEANGKVRLALLAYKNEASTTLSAGAYLDIDANGNKYFDFPKCTTKATTTSSAASNKVAVVVQNYVNGASWYRVWSDGWIEQGGRTGSLDHGANTTVTFLKPFSNGNYSVTATTQRNANAWSTACATNLAAATMTLWHVTNTGGATTISWYACGY
jgi:hypothetical protein